MGRRWRMSKKKKTKKISKPSRIDAINRYLRYRHLLIDSTRFIQWFIWATQESRSISIGHFAVQSLEAFLVHILFMVQKFSHVLHGKRVTRISWRWNLIWLLSFFTQSEWSWRRTKIEQTWMIIISLSHHFALDARKRAHKYSNRSSCSVDWSEENNRSIQPNDKFYFLKSPGHLQMSSHTTSGLAKIFNTTFFLQSFWLTGNY